MSEETDYKVTVTIDRKRVVEDITKLAQILARKDIVIIVSASTKEEAIQQAKTLLQQNMRITETYVKKLRPRKLPT